MRVLIRATGLIFLLFTSLSVMAESQRPTLYVQVEGVSGREANNVRNRLSIQEYHERQAPSASRARFLHQRAEREIRRALAPYGYYRPEIETSFEQEEDGWYLTYRITPGEQMTYRQITIDIQGDAAADRAFERLRNPPQLQPGQPVRHRLYEQYKSELRTLAAERGYYEASFSESALRVDMDDYAADVTLTFDSGPRYRFGEVRFSEGHLDEDVLQRFVNFSPGDPVATRELLDLQTGMSDTDYFSRVEVQPLWGEATGDYEVPVDVNFEPNNRTFYRAGLGYGTDTGPRLSFDQQRRWVNTRGHRFNSQFRLSEQLSTIGGTYIIPGSQPQTDQYALRALWTDEDTDNTRSERTTLGVSWQSQLTRTQRILSLDWQDERDRIAGVRRDTQYLIPSAQWTRIHADDRLRVSDGFRLSLTIRGAADRLGSDSDFFQSTLSGKYINRLTSRTRLLLRAEGGTSITGDFDQVPTSLRFYAGGDNSIRGYAYRSVGPRTEDEEEVLGGRHMFTSSIETDFEFRTNQRLAVFVDAGDAFNDFDHNVKVGAGIGYRWQSPVGPIRVDLAHGFSDPGDKIRLHFTLGPEL